MVTEAPGGVIRFQEETSGAVRSPFLNPLGAKIPDGQRDVGWRCPDARTDRPGESVAAASSESGGSRNWLLCSRKSVN